jgi:hypothetical protein
VIVVRCTRTLKRTAVTTDELRYYLSSAEPSAYTPSQWLALIQGHWAGVEIRNHWRRDAIWGEDRSRTRNPNALAGPNRVIAAISSNLYSRFKLPNVLTRFTSGCNLSKILIRKS